MYLPGCPVCLKYWRVNLSAASIDSDPPLKDLDKVQMARGDRAEFFDKIQGDVSDAMQGGGKGHLFQLTLNRLDYPRVAMAQHGHVDATDGVEVAVAFDVPAVKPGRSVKNPTGL